MPGRSTGTLAIMQNAVATASTSNKSMYRLIAIAALTHALLLLAWWWAAIYAAIDTPLVNGRVWLIGAWAWLGWPIYALIRARASRPTLAAVVVGAALIAPTTPTIYAFTSWAIWGFAP